MRERVGQTDTTAGLCRASKARFWSLVDFIFLRQTEPAWSAKWIRPPKVSVLTGADFVCVCVCVRTLEFETKLPFPPLRCRNGTYTVADGQVTCIAREMVLKRQLSETSDSGKPDQQQPAP